MIILIRLSTMNLNNRKMTNHPPSPAPAKDCFLFETNEKVFNYLHTVIVHLNSKLLYSFV